MSANDAELRIGGDASGLTDALKAAERSVKDSFDRMQSSMESLSSGFKKVQGAFLAVTAVIAGGQAFRAAISASADWALESAKLARSLGVSTEQASVMQVAIRHLGLESDLLVSASQKMSKQIGSNGQAFEKLGVQVKDASGNYRPVTDVMGEVNEKLKAITNPIAQNIAGMQVYGKSWGELRSILKLTSDDMSAAERRAKELGLVVTSDGVESAKQYKMQLNDLNLISKSLEIQFGNQLTPVFVRIGKWMGEEAPGMGKAFATVLESIAFVAQSLWLALKDMGDALGTLAAQAVALAHGDMAAVREMGRLRDAEYAKNEAAYERLKANFGKEIPLAKTQSAPETTDPQIDFTKTKSGSDTRFQEWKASLERIKESDGNFFKSSLETEESFWQAKLILVKGNTNKDLELRRQIQHEIYSIHKQQAEQERQLDEESVGQKQKLAKVDIDGEREKLRIKREMGEITESQELQALSTLLEREYEVEKSALQDKLKLYEQDKLAKKKILDEIELLQQQHAKSIQKINNDVLIAEKKSVEQTMTPISSAIEKSVTGMIMGTTTLNKALANLFQSILGEFVSMGAKMVVSWTAKEVAKFAVTQGFMEKDTALKLGAIGQQQAAELGANAITTASTVASNDAKLLSVAPVAAADAADSAAKIPYVGWILAAGAFASTMGMIMGSRKSASGGYDIPSGVSPLTQLHQEEMVLPAHIANPLRDSLAGGGLGGDTHLHIHTPDSAGVERLFRDNGHILAKELRRQMRNFAPRKS